MGVLVLDASMEILSIVDVKKGLGYIINDKGSSLLDTDRVAHSDYGINVPSIVLLKEAHAYKTRRKNKSIKWSKRGVLRRDDYSCAYCGDYGNTVDHIVPKDSGGQNEWMNTITACKPCNGRKDNLTLEQANMKLMYQPTVPTYFKRYLENSVSLEQKQFLIENSLLAE